MKRSGRWPYVCVMTDVGASECWDMYSDASGANDTSEIETEEHGASDNDANECRQHANYDSQTALIGDNCLATLYSCLFLFLPDLSDV